MYYTGETFVPQSPGWARTPLFGPHILFHLDFFPQDVVELL